MKTSWLNELYQRCIHFDGRSVITHGGFYGVTSGGLLLKLKACRYRGENFAFVYEAMPLIVPITGCPEKHEVTSCGEINANADYCHQMGWEIFDEAARPYMNLRDAPASLPLLERRCADILRLVDQRFRTLCDIRDYADFCKSRYAALSEEQRRAGISAYPADYPAVGNMFCGNGGYVYVCTFFGEAAAALARIRGERQYLRQVLDNSFASGYTAPDAYARECAETNGLYKEVEQALSANDLPACEAVLEKNYQKNRQLLSERLGFSLPESYKDICKAK